MGFNASVIYASSALARDLRYMRRREGSWYFGADRIFHGSAGLRHGGHGRTEEAQASAAEHTDRTVWDIREKGRKGRRNAVSVGQLRKDVVVDEVEFKITGDVMTWTESKVELSRRFCERRVPAVRPSVLG